MGHIFIRKKLRLNAYDYRSGGSYFLTLCTHGRLCLFGEIIDKKMLLNDCGQMLYKTWIGIPERYPNVSLDSFVIMPNHMHAIVIISEMPYGLNKSYSIHASKMPLPSIISNFKTHTTVRYIEGVKKDNWPPFYNRLWQRSFHERLIRTQLYFENIQRYIYENPMKWESEQLNNS